MPDLPSPHHPLDPVAQEHVAQHQAAHHGLGLGKLGNGHIEIIKARELHHEARRPIEADEKHQQEFRPPQEGVLIFPDLQVADDGEWPGSRSLWDESSQSDKRDRRFNAGA